MTQVKKEFCFEWQCPNCSTRNAEYIVDGSPSLEVLCEKCMAVTDYEELQTEEQVNWDIAREQEMQNS